MHVLARATLCLCLLIGLPRLGFGRCDPTTEPDATDVANARAAGAASCDCTTATSRAWYIRCASIQADRVLQNRSCRSVVRKCAGKSTCGRPGLVTCCRTTASGKPSCAIKRSADKCVAPAGGSACVGSYASCCDACGAGGCAPGTTTTTIPCQWHPLLHYCIGSCGSGEQCGSAGFDACACVPDNVVPCGDAGYPTCGGGCPSPDGTCMPTVLFGNFHICQCADPATACGTSCPSSGAVCPPGLVCDVYPGCGCVLP